MRNKGSLDTLTDNQLLLRARAGSGDKAVVPVVVDVCDEIADKGTRNP